MGGGICSMALMVVMSQVYTYFQTHQVTYIKYVQLFICQSYVNKVSFKKISIQNVDLISTLESVHTISF